MCWCLSDTGRLGLTRCGLRPHRVTQACVLQSFSLNYFVQALGFHRSFLSFTATSCIKTDTFLQFARKSMEMLRISYPATIAQWQGLDDEEAISIAHRNWFEYGSNRSMPMSLKGHNTFKFRPIKFASLTTAGFVDAVFERYKWSPAHRYIMMIMAEYLHEKTFPVRTRDYSFIIRWDWPLPSSISRCQGTSNL